MNDLQSFAIMAVAALGFWHKKGYVLVPRHDGSVRMFYHDSLVTVFQPPVDLNPLLIRHLCDVHQQAILQLKGIF